MLIAGWFSPSVGGTIMATVTSSHSVRIHASAGSDHHAIAVVDFAQHHPACRVAEAESAVRLAIALSQGAGTLSEERQLCTAALAGEQRPLAKDADQTSTNENAVRESSQSRMHSYIIAQARLRSAMSLQRRCVSLGR